MFGVLYKPAFESSSATLQHCCWCGDHQGSTRSWWDSQKTSIVLGEQSKGIKFGGIVKRHQCKNVWRNGTRELFVRRIGIRRNGIRQNGPKSTWLPVWFDDCAAFLPPSLLTALAFSPAVLDTGASICVLWNSVCLGHSFLWIEYWAFGYKDSGHSARVLS